MLSKAFFLVAVLCLVVPSVAEFHAKDVDASNDHSRQNTVCASLLSNGDVNDACFAESGRRSVKHTAQQKSQELETSLRRAPAGVNTMMAGSSGKTVSWIQCKTGDALDLVSFGYSDDSISFWPSGTPALTTQGQSVSGDNIGGTWKNVETLAPGEFVSKITWYDKQDSSAFYWFGNDMHFEICDCDGARRTFVCRSGTAASTHTSTFTASSGNSITSMLTSVGPAHAYDASHDSKTLDLDDVVEEPYNCNAE
jgi:hypothetical protein